MTDFEFEIPKKKEGVNLHAKVECLVCDGDRFVLVATRPPEQSSWMKERGIEPNTSVPGMEEYAPCPSCNATTKTEFYRPGDGKRVNTPDPEQTRRMMRG